MASHSDRFKTCRPREHMRAAGKLYPDAWRIADQTRAGCGGDCQNGATCQVGRYETVRQNADLRVLSGRLPLELVADVGWGGCSRMS